ncbi:MAG TPA: TPM domain-containing protein [Candidatus Dormibacteraeota bacterium]|nr:TPM domain-containing protein [Candidatus Dormibacteraeota bacterium]
MSSIARRVLLAGGALLAALGLTATVAAADDWGQRAAGRHVYDTASALSAQQVADLEQAAAAVDRAGAPTVVYLRSKDAGDAATRQDARALMDAWSLESTPGARDGFVLLLNLKPGDSRHGSAALVAGARHAAGRLDDARLQAIYDGTMKPYLARADLGGALAAALGAVVEDLGAAATAPPAPTPQEPSPLAVAGGLIGFGLAGAVFLGILVLIVVGGYRGGGPGGGGGGGRRRGTWWAPADGSSAMPGSSFTGDGGASSGSSSGGGSF